MYVPCSRADRFDRCACMRGGGGGLRLHLRLQAVADSGLIDSSASFLRKAHMYVEQSQVVDEAQAPLAKYYRHISKGAWPFSSRDHGWPISDCSSEGLKAALALARLPAQLVREGVHDGRRGVTKQVPGHPARPGHAVPGLA